MEIKVEADIITWEGEPGSGEIVTYKKKFSMELNSERLGRLINSKQFRVEGMHFDRVSFDIESNTMSGTCISTEMTPTELKESGWILRPYKKP